MKHKLAVKGKLTIQQWRKGVLIKEFEVPNGVTNEGKNKILDVMFNGTTQLGTWYMGLISNSGYTGVAAGDTMGSHAGWAEFTSYDEANRVEWTQGAASSQSMTNSATMDFTISATGTLKGGFLTSNNTKGGTTGTLWATALFAADLPVADDDVIKLTYTVTAS